jgi:hypothetical protein
MCLTETPIIAVYVSMLTTLFCAGGTGAFRHGFPISERQQIALLRQLTEGETPKTGILNWLNIAFNNEQMNVTISLIYQLLLLDYFCILETIF